MFALQGMQLSKVTQSSSTRVEHTQKLPTLAQTRIDARNCKRFAWPIGPKSERPGLPDSNCIVLLCSTEMGKSGQGAQYKFMIVQPNGKWMQEISDLIEQVNYALCQVAWE